MAMVKKLVEEKKSEATVEDALVELHNYLPVVKRQWAYEVLLMAKKHQGFQRAKQNKTMRKRRRRSEDDDDGDVS